MFAKFDKYMSSLTRSRVFILSFFCVCIIGYIDHLIAPRLSLSVFYAVPVAGAAWYINRQAGVFMSIFAALIWLAADLDSGHTYVHLLIPYWNCIVRLIFFLIITVQLTIIRSKLDIEESLADTDYLTGLKNSRSFYEYVEFESHRSRRSLKPMTIVYIDLDNFKYINDSLGHNEGDELLKAVGETLKTNIRQSDIISRLGGDEFAGLFPEADFDKSKVIITNIAEHLNKAMNSRNWPVTFSIGAITFNKPLDSTHEMIKAVDKVMYEVKNKSKNNIAHKNF